MKEWLILTAVLVGLFLYCYFAPAVLGNFPAILVLVPIVAGLAVAFSRAAR